MHGVIKAQEGVYPITVIDAVAVGDGSTTMLPAYLQENYIQQKNIASEVIEGDAAPISGAAAYSALETKITINGEEGQLPICNGDGTITWTTISWAEEGEY